MGKARTAGHSFTARQAAQSRKSASARGYDARWRKLRKAFLDANPVCVKCLEKNVYEQAVDVDHIQPHRGDDTLRLDWSNLQSLCKSCHGRKTATEDGGFGRARKDH